VPIQIHRESGPAGSAKLGRMGVALRMTQTDPDAALSSADHWDAGDRVAVGERAPRLERRSSEAEIEALYRSRYAGFRRALAAMTGSYETAHDVVQEAFARALAQRQQFRGRGEGPLAAWVWRIAQRVALDELARSRRLPVEGRRDVMEVDMGLVEPARDFELDDAVRTLPPRRRLIFFLRYFADFSYEEIAAACGISEGTVAASLAQSRAAVSEALGGSEGLGADDAFGERCVLAELQPRR
jgi:RNA polymerase sigma-70 factor (ECF subfamily)